MNGHDGRYTGHKLLMQALFGPTGQPPAWRRDAACTEVGPEVFYQPELIPTVRELCQSCPVMAQCRADQMTWESRSSRRYGEPVGLVGGMSAPDRQRAHRDFRRDRPAAA